jgi:type I restriction enzyme S subunit
MQDKIIDEVEVDENIHVMEKVKLDDVLKYEQPTKYIVKSANYSADFKTPVLTAGKTFVLGHTDETSGVFENFPVIIFDDFTTAFHYVDFPFKVKSSAMKILKNVEEKADLKYLFYKMQTISIDRDLHKRYWISKYSQLNIPLPPLPTQQKIAAILDKADELRQYNKQLIEKYEALTQSLFLDMFGDPVKNEKGFKMVTIRDLSKEVKYGTSEKASEIGKHTYLRMNNITYSGYMDFKNLKYVDLPEKDLPKYMVQQGDILFNRTNSKELVGKTGIITTDENFVIAGYLIRVRTNELANPYFIWAHLNSKWAKLTLNNMCKNIVGMANINAQELQDIKILKAPIELQNQFADRVHMIGMQKLQAKEALEKSEALFQGLLQQAFKGELN